MDKRQRFGVSVLLPENAVWPFNSAPYYSVQSGSYKRHEKIDPFPSYRHDMFLVNDTMKHVTKALPIDNVMDVQVSLLSHEVDSRVNGYAWATEYNDQDTVLRDRKWHGQIVLSAKRTPIHPGMTRYLVAHEYGHLVQRAVEIANGLTEYAFEEKYAEMRGVANNPAGYGGGTWHLSPGELFANDFRLLVCRVETEFWPHPDVARPETLPSMLNFWRDTAANFTATARLTDKLLVGNSGSTELALAV